jgi:LPXTG-motif cell wall-anchored protein
MLKIIGVLLVVWLAVSILGAVIKGLFWLTIVGAVLFVATAAYGYLKRRSDPKALR